MSLLAFFPFLNLLYLFIGAILGLQLIESGVGMSVDSFDIRQVVLGKNSELFDGFGSETRFSVCYATKDILIS